jgi:hypothetical protein
MPHLEAIARFGDRRFVRYADAVTQAEIRRLSRRPRTAPEDHVHDVVETVQHELRRLAHPGPAAAPQRADGRRLRTP